MTVEFFLRKRPDGQLEMRCSEMEGVWVFSKEHEARGVANVMMLKLFRTRRVSFGWESDIPNQGPVAA